MSRFVIPIQSPLRQIRVQPDGSDDLRTTPIRSVQLPPPTPTPASPTSSEASMTEMRRLFASLEETVRDHEERRQQSLGELQQLAVELAVAVASRVVAQAIEADQFGIPSLVEGLIAKLGLNTPLQVFLNPGDLQLLKAHLAKDPASWDPRLVTFNGDPSLPRGTCRGESAQGTLLSDAALHLAELRRHLLEGLDDAEIERRHPPSSDRGLRRFPDRRETA